MNGIKARFVRNTRTRQSFIELEYSNRDKTQLFHGIVEHCAHELSDNELKTVYERCSRQLLAMNTNDVPLVFREMMRELEQAIINRKTYRLT